MKHIRTLFITVLSAAMLLSAASCSASEPASEFDDGKMRKNMTAMEYAKEMGLGINLGNTMEAYWANGENKTSGSTRIGDTMASYETCWGAVVTTQEAIDGMKAEGFSTIRVPVYWGNAMEDDGKFEITEQMFDRVEEIVNYCRKDDLYTVINIHHYDEYLIKNYPKEEVLEITQSLWTQIAEHFKNYSDYLVFEGYNESLGNCREEDQLSEDEKFTYVNELNQTFVDAVRETGGNNENRLLISSGYWTNIDRTTDARFVMPQDSAKDKMMVSVHYIDNAMYWSGKIGNDKWREYSRSQCELLKKAFTDQGIPVFVGECTSIYERKYYASNADVKESTASLEEMYNLMFEYGFVPVLWDVNDNFYSRTEYRIKSDSDRALIARLAQQLKSE